MESKNFNALPDGYILDSFKIISFLGGGGFGIAYLAEDIHLEKKFVIKEYLPNEFSYREQTTKTVHPKDPSENENYAWGLKEFINEAKTIAKFDHLNIVQVTRYFEANNTAYIVMRYAEGDTLTELLSNGETATEEEIKAIVIPLLNGLKVVHSYNILHRDIKPSNIYIHRLGNVPLLIDFGAARYSLGSHSRSITTIITPGYSPYEQYQTHGNQGVWTDIYAMGAVMYRLISGEMPIESSARVMDDPLVPAVEIGKGKYSSHLLAAIDHALMVREKDRPQSVDEWLEEINNSQLTPQPQINPNPEAQTATSATSANSRYQSTPPQANSNPNPNPTFQSTPQPSSTSIPAIAWVMIIVLVAGIAVLATKLFTTSEEADPIKDDISLNIQNGTNGGQRDNQPAIEQATREQLAIEKEARDRNAREQAVREQAARGACTDGRLNSAQIKKLVNNKVAIGERLDIKKRYSWMELQKSNGVAAFQKKGGNLSKGRWKIEYNALCWCYGECTTYKCKYVEARNNCSIWDYRDTESKKITGRVYRFDSL